MNSYTVSRFVQRLVRGKIHLISHGMRLERMALDEELDGHLRSFEGGQTLAGFERRFDDPDEAPAVLGFFLEHGLLVAEGADEEAELIASLGLGQRAAGARQPLTHEPRKFDRAEVLTTGDLRGARELAPLRVLLVGGCFLQVAPEFLRRVGLQKGYTIEVHYRWPEDIRATVSALRGRFDIAVLHPFVVQLLSPLWNDYALLSPAEREERYQVVEAQMSLMVSEFLEAVGDELGIIHGLTSPQVSPAGSHDHSFGQLVHRLNRRLLELISGRPGILLLDEERLASGIGKEGLLDDLHMDSAHHGYGLTDEGVSPWADEERSRRFCHAMCRFYLDSYDTWRGRGILKCVVVDLDRTLWPGVAGDEGIGFRPYVDGINYQGIHEALRALRSRGILLVTCSKNDEASLMASWRAELTRVPDRVMLTPDDFVWHRVNWRPKSENVAEIARRLGLGLDAILFVDDNPVERAEVRSALPDVQVWEGEVFDLRRYLLTEPRLDRLVQTAEAGQRSEMMRGQLARESLREEAPSERAFLASLGIKLEVARATTAERDRALELIQRTNQFNTTLRRLSLAEVNEGIAQGRVWCLRAQDRFTHYGLVGVIVMGEREVELVVISCRVIGLAVGVPFLSTVLRAAGAAGAGLRGRWVDGPRNEPARSLFREAGFTPDGEGGFVLGHASALAEVDPSTHEVAV